MALASSPAEEHPPVALEIACQSSTADWQLHLEQLFNNARDRFPDVVWELLNEGDVLPSEEVWGHKAMVYARAPPTFQARYFSFRPAPIASPSPYGPSPMPAQSAVSLGLSMSIEAPSPARSPSPNSSGVRALSPTPSTTPGQLLRLTTTIASALFSQELEYLYTGKSFGDAFEFLFDSPEKRDEGDGERNRLEKLRKDLVFMWRSRLYSDVRIQLSGNFSSSSTQGDPMATAVFSSHRFILVSRSPYFRTQLLGAFAPPTPAPGQPLTLTLPSPPFTPASLHFTLGFIYTGTLSFSHRTYDLETAFHIMRAATYLSIASLYAEIEARIVEEMCHGLFHAYMPFDEYEKLTAGKWGATGCKCRQCARRAPRVLEFATLEDVKNEKLANGARRTLVGLFGDGWCTPEFAALPPKTRDSLLRGVQKRTIPLNVFPLLYAAQRALTRLNSVMDAWAHTVREMVLAARKNVDEVLCEQADACFEQPEWLSVMDADGGRFEDGEKVEWVMDCVRRGLTEQNAAMVYQTLVSSILLRPHPQDPNASVLSNTSGIRQQVDTTRMDVVKWMRKRWVGVQQEGGFDNLEGWALKELSDELEVPLEDLMRPSQPSGPAKGPLTRTGLRPTIASTTGKPEGDGDTASMTSLRASVLNRNMAKSGAVLASSASSVKSVASTASHASGMRARGPAGPGVSASASTTSSRTPLRASRTPSQGSSAARPPSHGSRRPSQVSQTSRTPSQASRSPSQASQTSRIARVAKPPLSTVSDRNSAASSVKSPEKPKSVTASVRSHASTIRKASKTSAAGAAGPSKATLGPNSNLSSRNDDTRPVSTASNRSDASTTFKTAKTHVNETRRGSITSTASNSTAGPQTVEPSKVTRRRRTSTASATSDTSSIASISTASRTGKGDAKKRPLPPKRPTSTTSVRSNVSTVSMTSRVAAGKAAAAKAVEKRESIGRPPVPALRLVAALKDQTASSSAAEKGKGKANRSAGENLNLGDICTTPSTTATSETSTVRARTMKRSVGESLGDVCTTPSSSTASEASTLKARSVKSVLRKETTTDKIIDSVPNSDTPRQPKPSRPPPPEPGPPSPQPPNNNLGATLNVGIPCIISSKRSRFRAFARYIGELEGERGSWVGVEVPVGEGWSTDKLEGRPWNDGTWGGRRYFDIGAGMEWDESDERRKRRKEGSGGQLSRDRTLKREGEQLVVERTKRLRSVSPAASDASVTESRGLFVRPQDVIYVVDAESDF